MKKQIMLMTIMCMVIAGTSVAQHDHSEQMKKDDHSMHMKKDMDGETGMIKKYDVDTKFQAQLNGVMSANQNLVDAFLHDDEALIKKAITELSGSLMKVDMSLLSGEAHHKWMEYMNEIKSEAKQITGANDIDFQRIHLAKLNDALYKSLKAFGTGGTEVYYNYCPMANSVGANWLTTSSEIQNPYMGQKMPKCGSNKEILN